MGKPRIQDRIRAALLKAGGSMCYYDLMRAVFPKEDYPDAFRFKTEGGPPGCAMAFGAALKRMGCYMVNRGAAGRRTVVLPRSKPC